MTRWNYQTFVVEDGMVNWDDGSGHEQTFALASALRLLGSQGYELCALIPEGRKMGHKSAHTLVFKRPETDS